MPGERPYNENLLARETAIISGDVRSQHFPDVNHADPAVRRQNQMLVRLADTSRPPEPFAPEVIHDPNFQHDPGKLFRLGRLIGRTSLMLIPDGRRLRAQHRAEVLQHRLDSAAFVGDKVEYNPRQGNYDPKRKIGWPGVHKTGSTPVVWRPEARDNLGTELLDFKADLRPGADVPNVNRPGSGYEHRTARRFNRLWDKRRLAAEEGRWHEKTYGNLLNAGSSARAGMNREERRAMRGASKIVEEGAHESGRLYGRMRRVTGSDTMRGRITRARLARARRLS